jgi:hypothetical protein
MSALAHAVYDYVATNPGEKSVAITSALASTFKTNGWSSASINAYLSLMKKAGLLKVAGSRPDGGGASTYYVQRNWDAALLARAMPRGGKRRGVYGVPPKSAPAKRGTTSSPRRHMRRMLDACGASEVISALYNELLAYGADNEPWLESMTEEVTEVFETAFDTIQTTVRLLK